MRLRRRRRCLTLVDGKEGGREGGAKRVLLGHHAEEEEALLAALWWCPVVSSPSNGGAAVSHLIGGKKSYRCAQQKLFILTSSRISCQLFPSPSEKRTRNVLRRKLPFFSLETGTVERGENKKRGDKKGEGGRLFLFVALSLKKIFINYSPVFPRLPHLRPISRGDFRQGLQGRKGESWGKGPTCTFSKSLPKKKSSLRN